MRTYTIEELEYVMNDIAGNVAISSGTFRALVGAGKRYAFQAMFRGRGLFYRTRGVWIEDCALNVVMNRSLKADIDQQDGASIDVKIRTAYLSAEIFAMETSSRFASLSG